MQVLNNEFSVAGDIDEELDYDMDEVIDFVKSSATQEVFDNSIDHLIGLVSSLKTCQQSFHSKKNNFITEVYQGFSDAIGCTSKNNGVTGIINHAAELFETCYAEANKDNATLMGEDSDVSTQSIVSDSSDISSEVSSSWDGKNLITYGPAVHSQTGNVGKEKVEYTDAELELMARMVANESGGVSVSRDGAVAVAEEIRNRVLSDDPYYKDTVQGVLEQGYLSYVGGSLPEASAEDIEVCKNVLNGTEWIFDNPNVLSHASHVGDSTYSSQKGVDNSHPYSSFYYDNIGRTQTFYTS